MVLRTVREYMLSFRVMERLKSWCAWDVGECEVLVDSKIFMDLGVLVRAVVLWYASVCLLQSSWMT